jgi:hypothetical protein
VGTLLLDDVPVTGNFFYPLDQDPLSLPDQVRAMRGQIRATTAGPGDLRYTHAAGPIVLDRHESQDIRLAVVAGESKRQLLDNAAAAREHVRRQLSSAISDASETGRMTTVRSRIGSHSRPVCKNCQPR